MNALTSTATGFQSRLPGAHRSHPGVLSTLRSFLFGNAEGRPANRELKRLDDRMLADIGLSRGDLPRTFEDEMDRMRVNLGCYSR